MAAAQGARVQTRTRSLFFISLVVIGLGAAGCAPANPQKLPDEPGDEVVNPKPAPAPETPPVENTGTQPPPSPSTLSKYDYVDPTHLIATKVKNAALAYYDSHLSSIPNKAYLSVIDFSLPSNKKRFFIINISTGAVWAMHVAHGKGSDANGVNDGFADHFSNTPGSNASSLGVYRTAETYIGDHGLSLRMDGLSTTNSNVRDRTIVIHQADYVVESDVIAGRSWGCFAIANENRDKVVSILKNGSIIYAGLSN